MNAKAGLRFGFGEKQCNGQSRSSLYVGYGQALTHDKWYENLSRIEYQINY